MADLDQTRLLRLALRETLPPVDQAGAEPERGPAFTYVPPSHARALDPDNSVVQGIRGSGKSFWWAHLTSEPHRRFIRGAFPEVRFDPDLRVVQAFGAQPSSENAPSQAVLASLIKDYPARAIWRAVCAAKVEFAAPFPQADWQARVAWVHENPEAFDTLLTQADRELESKNQTLVVLFDALDRLADDWPSIRPLARGLLQTALDLRATRRIRFKVFVRPDMLQDRDIIGFPDASKLWAREAKLAWRRADLYALLFQCLGNSRQGGESFRSLSRVTANLHWRRENVSGGDAWSIPATLRTDEGLQEQLFIALAGKAMASAMASGPSGYKRGKPYTWLVNHLQDGLDQVSPRSFFAALREAADRTAEDSPLALDYRAIQAGVQAASQIRVNEITREDYPWVDLAMQPLRGKLTVPCTMTDIENIWSQAGTLESLREELKRATHVVKLPPQSLNEGAEGVLKDLAALGLINRLSDQRVQMPDVYRIAFGLGRRGGVKPLK
ncbi:hypothetical protein [uncultured Thiodictyon sp.]|uniref:hypothetical protein n=1 Tax=uncultured Thiodictyon sp. TaxID=1846217 RepID=UPI0025EC8012|nr:hypothetical protein [uncultured Thiodictyon sp.]